MTAPVRERLLAAIVLACGAVYGLESAPLADELPVTVVRDDGSDTASTNYDFTTWSMQVIVGRLENAASSEAVAMRAQAHDALAGLITLMHADETFGGLAQGVEITAGEINLYAGAVVEALATFTVRYQHLRGQPAVLTE